MKNITKRLLASILAAGTLLTVTPAFAEMGGEITKSVDPIAMEQAKNDELKAEYAEELALLSGLGIISDTNIKMTNSITRGEFLNLVMKMIKMNGLDTANEETVFYDVLPNSDYYEAVMNAHHMGLINGDDKGCFNPDKTIDYASALKILVCALEFRSVGEAKGGYPNGFIAAARDLEIVKNVSVYGIVTWGDAIDIIGNALHSYAAVKSYDSTGNVTVQTGEQTVLKKYYDTARYRGIVEETNLTLRMKGKENDEAVLQIGGKLYTKLNITPDEGNALLGKVVIYYINEETDEIYAIAEDNRYNSTIVIDAKDIQNANLSQVRYWNEKDKEVKVNISNKAAFYYNGIKSYDMVAEDMEPEQGTITLIDSNNDKVMDIVIVESWYDMVIKNCSTNSIESLYNDGKNIDLTEVDLVFYKNGYEVNTYYVAQYDTAKILLSKDGKQGIARVSGYELAGEVTQLKNTEDGKPGIAIDGTLYELSQVFIDAYTRNDVSAPKPVKGNKYRFILNEDNVVFGITRTTLNELTYGYMLKAASEGGLSQNYKVKIFGEQASMNIFDVAENVKVNGTKAGENFMNIVTGGTGTFTPQLVMYRVNDKNQLVELKLATDIRRGDGAATYDRDNFSLDMSYGQWWTQNGSLHQILGQGVFDDGTTKLFYIPWNLDEEDTFAWLNAYGNEGTYNHRYSGVELYDLVPIADNISFNKIGAVVVKQLESAAPTYGPYGENSIDNASGVAYYVIDEVYEELDGDGEPRITIDAWTYGGEKKTFYCADTVYNLDMSNSYKYGNITVEELKNGDVVRLSYANSAVTNPLIDRFKLYGRAENLTDETNNAVMFYDSEGRDFAAALAANAISTIWAYGDVVYTDANTVLVRIINPLGEEKFLPVAYTNNVWDYSETEKEIRKTVKTVLTAGDRILLDLNYNQLSTPTVLVRLVETNRN